MCILWWLNDQPENRCWYFIYITTEETLCLMKMSGKPSAVCEKSLPALFTEDKKYHPSHYRGNLHFYVYLSGPGTRWSVSWWEPPPLYVWSHSEAGLFSSSAGRDSPLRSDPRVLIVYPEQRNCLKTNSQCLSHNKYYLPSGSSDTKLRSSWSSSCEISFSSTLFAKLDSIATWS